jgi:gliding motility-associated-like protein
MPSKLEKPVLLRMRSLWLTIILLISHAGLMAQVTASFTMPDTVCVNTPITITNASSGASSYFWNFCTPSSSQTPQTTSLGNINNTSFLPHYIDYVVDNGNYYGFLINNSPGGLVRLDFGNSLLNAPTAVALGNFGGNLSNSAQGIQVVKTGGRWYAILVCGDDRVLPATSPRILKLDFGVNITNASPVATNWGNIGNLAYSHELFLFQDATANWYGFTVSYYNSAVTRFNFGIDFANPPTAVTWNGLGNINGPTGMFPVNDNGSWRLFITNFNSNTLTRLDFGTSLLNTPTGVNIGNPGNLLNQPRDLQLFGYCGRYIGYVANNNGTMAGIDFTDITANPTGGATLNIGASNITSISKIFTAGTDYYAFMPSAIPANLFRVKFPSCAGAGGTNSVAQAPATFSYATPGIYTVNLVVDEGKTTQASACRQVVVTSPATVAITPDTTVCRGDSVQLIVTNTKSAVWTPAAGLSSATVTNPKSSPSAATAYSVNVNDKNSCVQQLSVKVAVSSTTAGVSKSGDIDCSIATAQLTASGGVKYDWTPVTGLSSATIPNPVVQITQTTLYTVLVTNSAGCMASDTIRVLVNQNANPAVYQLPTAFTPNHDGKNDCFGVSKWGSLNKLQFYIYNRWGELIFFSQDPSKCWDGNFKGLPQASGSYVYRIHASTACNEIDRSGTIVLIR